MEQKIVYHLIEIDGDYALLRADGGEDNRVARALLPWNADEGDRLEWTFSQGYVRLD